MQVAATRPPDLEVRPPLGGRLAHIGIGGVGGWLAVVITITLVSKDNVFSLLAAAGLVVWIVYFYRLTSMVVVLRGDTLTVRNLLRTRHISRSSVTDVFLGKSSIAKAPSQTVIVKTSRGAVALEACARTLQSPRRLRKVEEFQRRLSEWSRAPKGSQDCLPAATDVADCLPVETDATAAHSETLV